MDPSLAPMIVMVTAIVTTGGVLVLRPLTKRLGSFLDVVTQERRLPDRGADLGQIRDLLASMDSRISLIEERQDFSEALLAAGERRAAAQLNGGRPGVASSSD